MYQILKDCDYLQSEWRNAADDEPDIDFDAQIAIDEVIEGNAYLSYAWKKHRIEYLSSIKALFSNSPNIENAPPWAKFLKSNANDVVSYTWKLSRRSDGAWAPALEVHGNPRSIRLKQKDRVLESENGIYYLYFLEQNGFNLRESMQISKGGNLSLEVPPPIINAAGGCMLFRKRGIKELIQPGNGMNVPDKSLSGGSFYVLTLQNRPPSIRLDEDKLVGEKADISIHVFHGFEYRIPYAPEHSTRTLYINDVKQGVRVTTRPRIVPCNSTDVVIRGRNEDIIAIEDTELRFFAYGMQKVCVDGEACQEQEPGSSYYCVTPEMHLGAYDGDIRNMRAIHYGTKVITAENGVNRCQLSVLFLPADWKSRCRHDDLNTVIKKARAGKHFVQYSSPDGEDYHLEYPLERPVIYWRRGNEMLECLHTEQYLDGGYNLDIISPNEARLDVKLIVGAREYLYHWVDSSDFLTKIFREAVNRVKIGDEIIIKIGEQVVYTGVFRPNFCYISDGRLFCPQSMRPGARMLCRGNSYYTLAIQFNQYLRTMELDAPDLEWDEYGGTDISEWYNLYQNEFVIQFLYDDGESKILIKEIVRDELPVNFEITAPRGTIQKRLVRCECDWETSSLPAFLHAFWNNHHLRMDASDIYDDELQQIAREITFYRLCNSYVGIKLGNEIGQPFYLNEKGEDKWWEYWALQLNTLKNFMEQWVNNVYPVDVLSMSELDTLAEKIYSMMNIENIERLQILWNNIRTNAGVSRLFVLALAISLGKGKVHLNVKEAVFLSYAKWFYTIQFPSALKRMCSFMELVKESPFHRCIQTVEYLFDGVGNEYIAIPGTNWLTLVSRLVHEFNLSVFWQRLADKLYRKYGENPENIMIAAIFYYLWLGLDNIQRHAIMHQRNAEAGITKLIDNFTNNGTYSTNFSKLNTLLNQYNPEFV